MPLSDSLDPDLFFRIVVENVTRIHPSGNFVVYVMCLFALREVGSAGHVPGQASPLLLVDYLVSILSLVVGW